MAGKPPRCGNEQQRPARRHASQESGNETEGSGYVTGSLGHDLVQGSEGKAALRETAVEGCNTEREDFGGKPLQPRQQSPQIAHDPGAVLSGIDFGGMKRRHESNIEQIKNITSKLEPSEPGGSVFVLFRPDLSGPGRLKDTKGILTGSRRGGISRGANSRGGTSRMAALERPLQHRRHPLFSRSMRENNAPVTAR